MEAHGDEMTRCVCVCAHTCVCMCVCVYAHIVLSPPVLKDHLGSDQGEADLSVH